MLNRIELIGNVGRQPILRHTNSGSAVCNIDLAVHRFKGGAGNEKYETDWIEVTVFEDLARFCAERLLKNTKIFAEGRIQCEKYEKNGLKIFRTRVVANRIILLSPREASGDMSAEAKGGDSFVVQE